MTDEEFYEQKHGHEMNFLQCQCSTAHTFGNVTAFIQNWLIDSFPEGLFKTIHVNSKIAHSQLRSTPKEFLKKSPPMFIIRPRIDWNDTSKFLHNTVLVDTRDSYYRSYGGTNLQNFFQDNRNKIAMKYQLNRHVMNFDVILVFNTLMQQINWANYINNYFAMDVPFFIDTCLESYLSPALLLELSNAAGVPMRDKNGSNAEFLHYLNSNSLYPITYKLQGSTQTEEYYRYYPVKLDVVVGNFSTDEGEKVGQIMDRYQISFSIRCEFYGTGFYYLFSDKIKERNIISVSDDGAVIIPVFTDVLTRDDINLPMGWKLYASPSCRLENPDDSLNLSDIFNESMKVAIKYHRDRGMPVSDFIRLRVRKQGKLIEYGKDYEFDFDNLIIHFKNCELYYTYKILLFINVDYINNLIKDVYQLK